MPVTSGFDILAAIDLRGGRVVRLEQGDFARETPFSDDPTAVATAFVEAGARWLHVVDLDGARSGIPAHRDTIASIIAAVGDRAAVEVAGGLRDEDGVAAVLDGGARRVVVGSAAIRDPGFAGRLVARHGTGSIAVAIDIRGGVAVGDGWARDRAGVDPDLAIRQLVDVGIETLEVTAIDRDGLLEGPDVTLYERLVAFHLGSIIASGGIASPDQVRALREIGCAGVIIGRALYDGRITIGEVQGFG